MAEQNQLPIAQARAGEPEAWDLLFRRFQLPLYVYVFELTQDEQASLDIVQETFISAARHLAGLREDKKFASWLFSIAHQKCIHHWRRRRNERALAEEELQQVLDYDDGPDELLIEKERKEQFLNLLRSLSPVYRSVLLLRFVEDFSLDQIAAITQNPLNTVKTRIHKAKKALRKLLEEKA